MTLSHLSRLLVLLVVSCVLIGCDRSRPDDIPTELQDAIEQFYAAIEEGDAGARIALFSDNAIMLPNHWTLIRGKAAIADVIRSGKGSVFSIRNRTMLDIDADGSLAYAISSYEYTYHAPEAEPQWHKTKNIHIWRMVRSGVWKLHADIWNSDVPIDAFGIE